MDITQSPNPTNVKHNTSDTLPAHTNGHAGERNNSLSICLLSYRSNPYSGGQGIYVHYLSRELAEMGHDVDVISGKPFPRIDHENVDLIKLPGLNLYESDDPLREFSLDYLQSPLKMYEWLSMISGGFPEPYTFGERTLTYLKNADKQYDIIHDNQSLCYGLNEMQELGYPVIATIHHPITVDREAALKECQNQLEKMLVRRWYRFLRMQRKVAPELSRVLTVSENSKDRISNDFKVDSEAISVVYNGIDTELFKPISDIETQPRRIMTTASSDVPLKGLRYLLQAVYQLIPKYPDLELIVVGELKENGETEELIRDLELDEHLEFHSEITHEHMVELYASASVAVVPSLFEGFGLPAGEAMACGVPLISTTGGGLEEVVGDAGILVQPEDPVSIANALVNLFENPAKRKHLGRAGRQRIKNNFQWETTARETVSLYRNLIHNENY